MDKIKENGFTISIVVLLLLLGALFYFWTLVPLLSSEEGSIDDIQSKLNAADRDLIKLIRSDPLPTPEYVAYKEESQNDLQGALLDALGIYVKKSENFNEFLETLSANTQPAEFQATFNTKVHDLKKKYQELRESLLEDSAKNAEENQDDPASGDLPFEVQEIPINDQDNVKRAMKHYWMIEEIFNNLIKHEITGLKSIKFPPNKKDDLKSPETYDVVRVVIEMELPRDKLKPFLANLFRSTRVPFIDVETLGIDRIPNNLLKDAIVETPFKRQGAAEDYKSKLQSVPEPPVLASLKLAAMDWKGLPGLAEKEDGNKEGEDKK